MAAKLKTIVASILSLALSVFCVGAVGCEGLFPQQSASSSEAPAKKQSPIRLDKSLIKLEVGKTAKLTLTKETEGEVKWVSYDSDVASVANDGTITAVSEGKTVIVATLGEYSASCDVTVVQSQVEAKNFTLALSEKTLVLNASNPLYKSAELSVKAYFNDEEVTASVAWSTSDEAIELSQKEGDASKATVTATENNKSAVITAKAIYQGATAIARCEVVSEPFAYISLRSDIVTVFMDEEIAVDYDLYVDGEKNESEKANITFTSSNEKVVKVEEGKLLPVSCGTANVTVRYGSRSENLVVEVGNVNYVSDAKQLLAIDGASRLEKFVLLNDINVAEVYGGVNAINNLFFIEELNGVLDGNGHTVYGFNRYSTNDYWEFSYLVNTTNIKTERALQDGGFDGIFQTINANAKIRGVRFVADIQTTAKNTASTQVGLLVGNLYGSIENCIFDIKTDLRTINDAETKGTKKYALYLRNMGNVADTVVSVTLPEEADTQLSVSNSGNGTNDQLSVIAPKLNKTASASGLAGDDPLANKFFVDSYHYKNIADFLGKTGYAISGTGVSATAHDFADGDNYDKTLFAVGDEVTFKDAAPVAYSFTREAKENAQISVGESLPLAIEGSVRVFNQNGNDVTSETYQNGAFSASVAGSYSVLCVKESDGAYVGSVFTVTVESEERALDNYVYTLSLNEERNLTMDGKMFIDIEYQKTPDGDEVGVHYWDKTKFTFTSDNGQIVSVNSRGVIKGLKGGSTTIRVMENDTKFVHFVSVTVKEDFNIKEFNGVISTGSSSESKVYVDGKLAGVTSSDKFDVYGYLTKAGKPAGKYEISVENNGQLDYAVYEIINLDNGNFLTELNKVNGNNLKVSFSKAQYKMYRLTENIALQPWTDGGYGDFTAKSGTKRYVFNHFCSNLDGQGYSINLSVNVKNSLNGEQIGGFAFYITGGIRNLSYNFSATYRVGDLKYYFGEEVYSGGFTDCVFKINATPLDETGKVVMDTTNPSVVLHTRGGGSQFSPVKTTVAYKNIVIILNSGGKFQNNFVFSKSNVNTTEYRNMIIVGNAPSYTLVWEGSQSFPNPKGCYIVKDITVLLTGGPAIEQVKERVNKTDEEGKPVKDENGNNVKIDVVNEYERKVSPNVLGITDCKITAASDGLYLYGQRVWDFNVISGDTVVSDGNIIGTNRE